jgi:hypothetical protein
MTANAAIDRIASHQGLKKTGNSTKKMMNTNHRHAGGCS